MSMYSALEKMAFGLAAAQVLCYTSEYNRKDRLFEAYLKFKECVENNREPEHCAVFQPYESWNREGLLEHIESEAEAILAVLESVLDLAKAGIVQTALEDELDPDMNQIDMNRMVEIGFALESA